MLPSGPGPQGRCMTIAKRAKMDLADLLPFSSQSRAECGGAKKFLQGVCHVPSSQQAAEAVFETLVSSLWRFSCMTPCSPFHPLCSGGSVRHGALLATASETTTEVRYLRNARDMLAGAFSARGLKAESKACTMLRSESFCCLVLYHCVTRPVPPRDEPQIACF